MPPPDLPRRAGFALGLATIAAGPAVLAANVAAAATALGPLYPWRFLAWGRRENPVNDTYFPRRPIAAAKTPKPLPEAPTPAAVEAALLHVDQRRGAEPLPLDPFLAQTDTQALLLARDGTLILEAYANGADRSTPLTSRSMAKSVLALLAALALAERRIPGVDTPLATLLPGIPGLQRSPVTLRHMLQMGGGLAFRGDGNPLGRLTVEPLWDGTRIAYFVAQLRRYLATAHPGTPPGTRFAYDDRSAQLVGLALERAFAAPLTQTLATRLWSPLGAEYPASWNLNSQADGLEKSESGINAAARDWLKLGQLVLDDGAGLIPPGAIAAMIAPIDPVPPDYYAGSAEMRRFPRQFYARFWWGAARDAGPPDVFMHGLYGQVVYISRQHCMVAVRLGQTEGGVDHWPALLGPLCDEIARQSG